MDKNIRFVLTRIRYQQFGVQEHRINRRQKPEMGAKVESRADGHVEGNETKNGHQPLRATDALVMTSTVLNLLAS